MHKERPILFSGAMVRAIMDGRKTQTRRVVKGWPLEWLQPGMFTPEYVADPHNQACPYGHTGDRLWVREAWRVGKPHDNTSPRDILPNALAKECGVTVLYDAGGWRSVGPEGRDEPVYEDDKPMPDWAGKGRPSIHMPRAMSRITLEITGVRIERLQDISEADAWREGAPDYEEGVDPPPPDESCEWSYRASFQRLWQSINGAGSWEANPWVWVVEFRSAAAAIGESGHE